MGRVYVCMCIYGTMMDEPSSTCAHTLAPRVHLTQKDIPRHMSPKRCTRNTRVTSDQVPTATPCSEICVIGALRAMGVHGKSRGLGTETSELPWIFHR